MYKGIGDKIIIEFSYRKSEISEYTSYYTNTQSKGCFIDHNLNATI